MCLKPLGAGKCSQGDAGHMARAGSKGAGGNGEQDVWHWGGWRLRFHVPKIMVYVKLQNAVVSSNN